MNLRVFRALLPLLLVATGMFAFAESEPKQAQPKLPTVRLTIGKTPLDAEVADDDNEREAGLMLRDKLEEGTGMLFVMDAPGPVGFWMHNTKIPLSIAFINPEGIIVEIHDMKPMDETVVASQFTTILYGLEVPQGWFLKNGILPGDQITGLPTPSEEEK